MLDQKNLRGWVYYYLIANAYQLTVDLNHWIRSKIRICNWQLQIKMTTNKKDRHILLLKFNNSLLVNNVVVAFYTLFVAKRRVE
nr:group II intron maturase-specific domain-containing protein [Pseudoalteromonas mariniglutinosa]